jgi:hypothetical protein
MKNLNQNDLTILITSLSTTINNLKTEYKILNITDQNDYIYYIIELQNKLLLEYIETLQP